MTAEPHTIQPPPPGGNLFVFQEEVHPDGGTPRRIAFTEVDIRPRPYEELAAARLHEGITIPLDMYNGRIVDTDIADVDTSNYAHLKATLVSPLSAQGIGLVHGGWLPSTLAATRSNAVVLPDRNIVTQIVGRFASGKLTGRKPDFLDLFERSTVRINPMLYALEGNGRSLPDPGLVQSQLDEAIGKLGTALPSATIMTGPGPLAGLLGLIEDIRPGMARKQKFLRQIAPRLSAQVARRDRDARWNEVLAAARDCGVTSGALVVLAALSVVVDSGACAARRMLKFHAAYSDADAYNALADLNALELLLYCLAYFPEMQTQLCNGDRNLALFWVGAGASGIVPDGNSISCTLTPHPAILPDPYAERWADEVAGT
ncbi:hypothetical protein M9978_19290 [Sphingomonas sp. MG17]|uniref:Uncharacterized protein n=1 Tax=Sphingomonas tagetis TaxID=2949092 RepID=A0A9X2HLZ3_9SPHN|nr:hypothetical protein [Sphingomonas tagetis]MCP3732572.1 hypothetical protein [Sphingomonas tagetis]